MKEKILTWALFISSVFFGGFFFMKGLRGVLYYFDPELNPVERFMVGDMMLAWNNWTMPIHVPIVNLLWGAIVCSFALIYLCPSRRAR